jgi:hypothetical protein
MAVRFLRGIFLSRDGMAVNDFEAVPTGDVTDLSLGVSVSGDCRWLTTVIFPPR